jgi:D-sedoheptulose 7-phosphate isomerase
MDSENLIERELNLHIDILSKSLKQMAPMIGTIVDVLAHAFCKGNKIMICGNGGSASDAQHVAAEFVNRFGFDRPALPALSLSTDTSVLTSIGNDSSFENIFSRQVEALARENDILIGISTSGRSKNVLKALDVAQRGKVITIGFTGQKGGEIMKSYCDYCLAVSTDDTPRIQECHEFIWHFICGRIENKLFEKQYLERGKKDIQ